jgi:hypothetical protein
LGVCWAEWGGKDWQKCFSFHLLTLFVTCIIFSCFSCSPTIAVFISFQIENGLKNVLSLDTHDANDLARNGMSYLHLAGYDYRFFSAVADPCL